MYIHVSPRRNKQLKRSSAVFLLLLLIFLFLCTYIYIVCTYILYIYIGKRITPLADAHAALPTIIRYYIIQ